VAGAERKPGEGEMKLTADGHRCRHSRDEGGRHYVCAGCAEEMVAHLRAALLKWPCDAGCKAGKIPAYLHGAGHFEMVCAKCNGSGIHPIASEALGPQMEAASK